MGEEITFEYFLTDSERIKTEFLAWTIKNKHVKTENLAVEQKPENAIMDIFDIVFAKEGIPLENRYHEAVLAGGRSSITSEFSVEQTRYPDMRIIHGNPSYKDILVEFEQSSSKLTNGVDGIEQAKQWFRALIDKTKYVALATSGFDSYIIQWDTVKNDVGEERKVTFREAVDFVKRTVIDVIVPASSRVPKVEITKRFYGQYRALLDGGKYMNPAGKKAEILEADCLVKNILNFGESKDGEIEFFAHVYFMRLIFLRIISAWRLIPDVLDFIFGSSDAEMNGHVRQLFFNIFDTEQEKRVDVHDGLKSLPYLNGGLFRRLPIEVKNPDLHVAPKIVRLIVTFLNAYQFSAESAGVVNNIDPEILGYIFEQSMYTRSEEGAFYTPKEVTKYMSQNAIQKMIVKRVNAYLEGFTISHVEQIYSLPESMISGIFEKSIIPLKILDPAVGSGAFLLACGDELLAIYHRFNTVLHKKESDYDIKRRIIANNLHGNDINPTAIEICQLRLWLWVMNSLEEGKSISPLPNLDFKMMAGNSLIGVTRVDSLFDAVAKTEQTKLDQFLKGSAPAAGAKKTSTTFIRAEIDGLSRLMREFVLTQHKEDTSRIKAQIDKKVEKIREVLNQREHTGFNQKNATKIDDIITFIKEAKPFHPVLEFCEVFAEHGGFDIVIANPPYLDWASTKAGPDMKFRSYYDVTAGLKDDKGNVIKLKDLYESFILKALALVNKTGIVEMIVRNNVMDHPVFPTMLPILKTFDNVGVGIFEGGYNKEASIFMLDPSQPARSPKFEFRNYLGTEVDDRLSLLGKVPIESKTNLTRLDDDITKWIDNHLSTWEGSNLEVHRGEELGKTALSKSSGEGMIRIYHVTHLQPFSIDESKDPRFVALAKVEKKMYSKGCVGLGYNIGNRIKASNLGTRVVIKSVLCVYNFPGTNSAIPSFLALYNSKLIDYFQRKIFDPFTEKRAFVINTLPKYPYIDFQDDMVTMLVKLLEATYSPELHYVLDCLIFEIVFRAARKGKMNAGGEVIRTAIEVELQRVARDADGRPTQEDILGNSAVKDQISLIEQWPWVRVINGIVPDSTVMAEKPDSTDEPSAADKSS
nr:hypothetical protein [Candidatus Sigynarchaeota archaeon]